jgi:hypothetical protein
MSTEAPVHTIRHRKDLLVIMYGQQGNVRTDEIGLRIADFAGNLAAQLAGTG